MLERVTDTKSHAPPPLDPYQQRAASLRTTATWLITTFGAFGAALITTLQLSNLSQASGARRVAGILGFAVGVSGVVLAIGFVGWVLASIPPGGGELVAPDVERSPEARGVGVLGGYQSVSELQTQWRNALTERRQAYDKYLKAFTASADAQDRGVTAEEIARLQQAEQAAYRRHEVAEREMELARPVVQRLLSFADLFEIRRRFTRAFKAVVFGVILAAIGVGTFAVAIAGSSNNNQSVAAQAPSVAEQPVLGTLDINDADNTQFQVALGQHCDLNHVPVDILAVDSTIYDLAVLPEHNCTATRLEIPLTEAVVVGEKAEPPATTTTSPSRSPLPPAGSG